eukprot:1081264-Pyramimonas_sp.AAC.1
MRVLLLETLSPPECTASKTSYLLSTCTLFATTSLESPAARCEQSPACESSWTGRKESCRSCKISHSPTLATSTD